MKKTDKKSLDKTLEQYKSWYGTGEYQKALVLIQPLAEEGDARAQYNLGVHYEFGHGVEQDDDIAALWYRKAAEQGDSGAQHNLPLSGGARGLCRGIHPLSTVCRARTCRGTVQLGLSLSGRKRNRAEC